MDAENEMLSGEKVDPDLFKSVTIQEALLALDNPDVLRHLDGIKREAIIAMASRYVEIRGEPTRNGPANEDLHGLKREARGER